MPDTTANTFHVHRFDAVIFDLDGVVTRTSHLHARAWQNAFNALRNRLIEKGHRDFRPFDPAADYDPYVNARPRIEGAAAFLRARSVDLPEGDPSDDPGFQSVAAVANLKNELFTSLVESEGVDTYPDTLRCLHRWRAKGLKTAIASSSRNARDILRAVGLTDQFDIICDGADLLRLNRPGKPAPDLFLETARRLNVSPDRAAVIEDAEPGVQAASDGRFALVIGVERAPAESTVDLRARGAHIVCSSLDNLQDDDTKDQT